VTDIDAQSKWQKYKIVRGAESRLPAAGERPTGNFNPKRIKSQFTTASIPDPWI
jgi:hypothetical protein